MVVASRVRGWLVLRARYGVAPSAPTRAGLVGSGEPGSHLVKPRRRALLGGELVDPALPGLVGERPVVVPVVERHDACPERVTVADAADALAEPVVEGVPDGVVGGGVGGELAGAGCVFHG